jgi:hypothetical protein
LWTLRNCSATLAALKISDVINAIFSIIFDNSPDSYCVTPAGLLGYWPDNIILSRYLISISRAASCYFLLIFCLLMSINIFREKAEITRLASSSKKSTDIIKVTPE